MALQHPGDEDLLDYYIFIREEVVVALYEYSTTIEPYLQYLGKAAGLQQTLGDKKYGVFIATEGQHIENGKLGNIILFTTNMFRDYPGVASELAIALTGGDKGKLFADLKAIQDKVKVRYNHGV